MIINNNNKIIIFKKIKILQKIKNLKKYLKNNLKVLFIVKDIV